MSGIATVSFLKRTLIHVVGLVRFVSKQLFGSKKTESIAQFGKLHNEELPDLYRSVYSCSYVSESYAAKMAFDLGLSKMASQGLHTEFLGGTF